MPRIYFKKRVKRPKTPADKGMQFSSKKIPPESILTILSGILCIFSFFGLSIYSTLHRGRAGIVVGIIGMAAFLVSLIGFILSLRAMKKDNVFVKYPIISAVVNMIALILFLVIYSYGSILLMI